VKSLIRAYTKEKGQAAFDVAFAEYSSNWGPTPSQNAIKHTLVDIGTDYLFLVANQVALYLHAAHAKSGRSYSYLFTEPSFMAGPGRPYPQWVGADHADEMQYMFGKPFTTPTAYGDSQRDLSAYMIAYWTNFARTGDPNKGPHSVPTTWPEFTSTGHRFLEINAMMDETYARQGLRMSFVRFWASTFPGLPFPSGDTSSQ